MVASHCTAAVQIIVIDMVCGTVRFNENFIAINRDTIMHISFRTHGYLGVLGKPGTGTYIKNTDISTEYLGIAVQEDAVGSK